ncbi:Protein YTP1 [Sphaceloma murrayae]|uniref:Protein YTP1 n=1 Tax=Sphaceloma murrayae TaxID=2082308 RepID=A0A2K1R2E3_9PEZI|nr:Protein YTP1 [Sphaceloma murrayae]
MSMEHSAHSVHHAGHTSVPVPSNIAPTYFNHPDHAGWIYAHIILMTVAWVVLLPLAVFVSTAKSRLATPIQSIFLVVNGLGIFTSIIYDAKTPDLYPNNSHHKIGWAVTWIAIAWFLLGLLNLFSRPKQSDDTDTGSHAMTSQTMAQYERLHGYDVRGSSRFSRDSGHGTERNSSTCSGPTRTNSTEHVLQKPEQPTFPIDDESEYGEAQTSDHDSRPFLRNPVIHRFMTRRIPQLESARLCKAIDTTYTVLERLQVILSFLALTTGFVTWIGIFHSDGLLNGLAHWIKGGIFFWYGLLTLGRWMGAWASWGWAWNLRPDRPIVSRLASRMPSAEFTESFVIFLYGATNVFLEHLTAWGKEWSMMDLEHISITIMFFGGGLLGMLVESPRARRLLNASIELRHDETQTLAAPDYPVEQWERPKSYTTSLNPVPALVIFLLGLVMSSHHQDSATSTTVHAQWGTLFSGFALARLATYLLMYLAPPTSYYPSRPPTELVASFCLVCGGLVFMASTRDVIKLLDRNGLHAMFVLTVVVGLTCLIMVWAVVLYGVRGWALRRERRRA